MRAIGRRAVASVGAMSVACLVLAGAPAASATTPQTDLRSASATADDQAAQLSAKRLAERIKNSLGARDDDVSVVVHDRRSDTYVTHNKSLQVQTASIVKVMVLVALIDRRRASGRGLTASDRALARRMITLSDNDATSTLLRRAGGSAALTRLAKRLDMDDTRASGSWGLTRTTAPDQVRLMDAIVDGRALRKKADTEYVLGLMGDVIPEQAWGVGSVPASASAQVKNGWLPLATSGSRRKTWRINSIGHVTGGGRDYTMAMLSTNGRSMDSGIATLDRVSEIVFDGVTALGRPAAGTAAHVSGQLTGPVSLPAGAPSWFESPGAAFRPYPTR